jgi:hypothetical protein
VLVHGFHLCQVYCWLKTSTPRLGAYAISGISPGVSSFPRRILILIWITRIENLPRETKIFAGEYALRLKEFGEAEAENRVGTYVDERRADCSDRLEVRGRVNEGGLT